MLFDLPLQQWPCQALVQGHFDLFYFFEWEPTKSDGIFLKSNKGHIFPDSRSFQGRQKVKHFQSYKMYSDYLVINDVVQ